MEYSKILGDFYRLHKFVILMADVMFVNGIAFLRNIKMITVEHIPNRTVGQLAKSLMIIFLTIRNRWFCR